LDKIEIGLRKLNESFEISKVNQTLLRELNKVIQRNLAKSGFFPGNVTSEIEFTARKQLQGQLAKEGSWMGHLPSSG